MSPVICQSLSRNVLKSLIKGDSKLDYNKAFGNVKELYRTALGGNSSEVQIPLPADEKPRVKPGELSDVEIEHAIAELFDYFEANLQTLKHLSWGVDEGDCYDTNLEGGADHHRGFAYSSTLRGTERHAATDGQGGGYRLQVAQGKCHLPIA
jgi:hypothetical protein